MRHAAPWNEPGRSSSPLRPLSASLAQVADAVAGDVLAGLGITAVRGASGASGAWVNVGMAAVTARLRSAGLHVVVLAGTATANPAKATTVLLAAAGITTPARQDARCESARGAERDPLHRTLRGAGACCRCTRAVVDGILVVPPLGASPAISDGASDHLWSDASTRVPSLRRHRFHRIPPPRAS